MNIEDKYLNEGSNRLYPIKDGVDVSTDDFWYDLTRGGYLKPKKILANPAHVKEVEKAIEIVRKFEESCEEQIEGFIR